MNNRSIAEEMTRKESIVRKSIEEWMEEKHISNERLAADTDVSVPTVYRWKKNPERITFAKGSLIAKSLGVDLSEIVFLP